MQFCTDLDCPGSSVCGKLYRYAKNVNDLTFHEWLKLTEHEASWSLYDAWFAGKDPADYKGNTYIDGYLKATEADNNPYNQLVLGNYVSDDSLRELMEQFIRDRKNGPATLHLSTEEPE